uniref:ribosomal protein L35 n=1 Tax=Porphyridium aerugineum TaxID=2792 RepID=UPI001FCE222D|nr:ribosomal protein L35 [Porphyridium aerugineum]UNJ17835.1 ribosomal protein L35 [Porphyridium aerugineum]
MTKLKTSKSIAKRFRITANKKILRRQAFKSHLLEKKSSNRKRSLRNSLLVNKVQVESILKKLPYYR